MDELVEEKLRAMGYKTVPTELKNLLREFKKRQDAVRPMPLSLDAIVACSLIYEMFKALASKQPAPGQKEQEEAGKGEG